MNKFGNLLEKSKIDNLVTLFQLTPLVGFLPMAGKICSTRENFPKLTSFQLKYWLVLETLTCLWNFRLRLGKKWTFQQFLPFMVVVIVVKVVIPNCRCITESWQITFRYAYIFRKSNSINPINHNLSFCGAKSSFLFVKYKFMKTHFIEETLDFASQKLSLWPIGLMEFDFLKM